MAFQSKRFGKVAKVLIIFIGIYKRYQLGADNYPKFSKMMEDG